MSDIIEYSTLKNIANQCFMQEIENDFVCTPKCCKENTQSTYIGYLENGRYYTHDYTSSAINPTQKSAVNENRAHEARENRAQEANEENRHRDIIKENSPKENDQILKELNSVGT